jgi:hypothetical protein
VVVVVTGGGWVVCGGGGCVVVVVTGGWVIVTGGAVVVDEDDVDDGVVLLELVVELDVGVVVLIRVGCWLPVTTTMPPPDGGIDWGAGDATPVTKIAANAAPTSAPSASRPESPNRTNMRPDYLVHSFGSS